jgi:hypothetical protein
MEMIFIRSVGDVEEDVILQKYDVAMVASNVDYVSAMIWHSMSTNFWAVWDLKGCSF